MEIGKSFGYVFEDPGWVRKIAIGGGIVLVGTILSPLLGIPLLIAILLTTGYYLTVIRNAYEGRPMPLPEWNDFGGFFMKGVLSAIGSLIVLLPAILLDAGSIFTNIAALNASGDTNSSQAVGLLTFAT